MEMEKARLFSLSNLWIQTRTHTIF